MLFCVCSVHAHHCIYLECLRFGSESYSLWGIVTWDIWHFCQVTDLLNYHGSLARAVLFRLGTSLRDV